MGQKVGFYWEIRQNTPANGKLEGFARRPQRRQQQSRAREQAELGPFTLHDFVLVGDHFTRTPLRRVVQGLLQNASIYFPSLILVNPVYPFLY